MAKYKGYSYSKQDGNYTIYNKVVWKWGKGVKMVDKITYEDKELLQNDESIPRKNKVTAKDLNEIKEVVNNHAENMNTKQDKEEGKGLTSNDFTNEYKEKLESLENYNDTEIKESMSNL